MAGDGDQNGGCNPDNEGRKGEKSVDEAAQTAEVARAALQQRQEDSHADGDASQDLQHQAVVVGDAGADIGVVRIVVESGVAQEAGRVAGDGSAGGGAIVPHNALVRELNDSVDEDRQSEQTLQKKSVPG